MSINVYSVANHLQNEGWTLISNTYKNLDTELEMECPAGHRQFQTYKNWRKHPQCEQCMAGDPYKIKKNKVPAKNADTVRVLALDAATNITGYSIYDDRDLVSYVGIEGIQLQSFGNNNFQVETYRILANLQGVLIDTLFEACIDHDLVSVNTWRNYCNVGQGTGRENKKKQAQDKVKLWYNQNCTQDEADAICIGKYFAHLLKNNKQTWGEKIND